MALSSRGKFGKEKTLDDEDGRQVKENVGIENEPKNFQRYELKNVHKNIRKKDSNQIIVVFPSGELYSILLIPSGHCIKNVNRKDCFQLVLYRQLSIFLLGQYWQGQVP